jgi:mannose-6-phosphate isomerase-like protein (cupin superfamily)
MRAKGIAAAAMLMALAGTIRAEQAPFRGDIAKLTEQNTDFRRVLFTGHNVQVVAMSIPPGENIGAEVHTVDQCFFFIRGTAETTAGRDEATVGENGVLCVPAGTRHDIRNSGREQLKLYTTYSPPQHPPGTVHRTKADAQRAEEAPPHGNK